MLADSRLRGRIHRWGRVLLREHPPPSDGQVRNPMADRAVFQAYQHRDNVEILEKLRGFFGCGSLVPKGPRSSVVTYSVHARKDPGVGDHPVLRAVSVDLEEA